MISFWISVVPPTMGRTLKIIGHALFSAARRPRRIAGCSRSPTIPRIASSVVARVIGGADRSWLGLWVFPCGLGGGVLSALVLSSAGRVWIVSA
jgi:hypothetical protein